MATPEDLAAAGLHTIDNAHCHATAVDLGATVLSWRPHGAREVLFLSEEAAVAPDLETHGGIPICAPWFGRGRDGVTVPRPHGLVRWLPWDLVARTDDERGTHLHWVLDAPAFGHLPGAEAYPEDLRFRLEATFGAELGLALTVNSPTTAFVLDEAFHTYFSVPAAHTRILGLDDVEFRDHGLATPTWCEPEAELVPDRHVDRVYQTTNEVALASPDQTVRLRTRGAGSVVVWNPGPDVPVNFGAQEWRDMVCVEVGNVQDRAVTVPAGGSHTLALTVSVELTPGHGSDAG